MKMVHGNTVFKREEAKLARNTHWYTFSMQNFTTTFNSVNFPSFNSVNFPKHKANYIAGYKKLFYDYDIKLGGITPKSWYLLGAEASQ